MTTLLIDYTVERVSNITHTLRNQHKYHDSRHKEDQTEEELILHVSRLATANPGQKRNSPIQIWLLDIVDDAHTSLSFIAVSLSTVFLNKQS